jgi:hypothetical protein
MSLEKLAASLQYLQLHWGCQTQYGIALRSIFELVQIETGLEGNFLLRDFHRFGVLASHTWFKGLWEYLDCYKVQLQLESVSVPPVRERDRVFMEEVVKILPPNQWVSINRSRHYFKVYFLSRLVLCDGITVNPLKLQLKMQHDSQMKFPHEIPTRIMAECIGTLDIPHLPPNTSTGLIPAPPVQHGVLVHYGRQNFFGEKLGDYCSGGEHSYIPKTQHTRLRNLRSIRLTRSPGANYSHCLGGDIFA